MIVGIIAEYNPFHAGHAYHIAETKKRTGDAIVVAAISGCFTQRGDFALADKFTRARAAVACGVDLVIEMPAPYALSSAEGFARAGVFLLNACGADFISFGGEEGDVEPLKRLAAYLNTPEFNTSVKEHLSTGISYAAAREMAAAAACGADASLLHTPNSTLAVEYIRAIMNQSHSLKPLCVKRFGASHDSAEVAENASASLIRALIYGGKLSEAKRFMPAQSFEVISEAIQAGAAPPSADRADAILMSHLRRLSPSDYAVLSDVSEGLEYRLADAVRLSLTYDEAVKKAATRRYPLARIRRVLIRAFLNITADLILEPPPYIRVLCVGERGREVLRPLRNSVTPPIIIRASDAKLLTGHAKRVFCTETLACDLYSLVKPAPKCRAASQNLTEKPVL